MGNHTRGKTGQAIILAGGMGSRLGELTRNVPKPLLPVQGRPFIAYLLRFLASAGIMDVVISTGYLAEMFDERLKGHIPSGMEVTLAKEFQPLGTGGATRHAMNFLHHPTAGFYLLNGDSYFRCNIGELEKRVESGNAYGVLALKHVHDAMRFGRVTVEDGKVMEFGEKKSSNAGWINTGIGFFYQDIKNIMPEGKFSLEEKLYPMLVRTQRLLAHCCEGDFLDIGTPESYKKSESFVFQTY